MFVEMSVKDKDKLNMVLACHSYLKASGRSHF